MFYSGTNENGFYSFSDLDTGKYVINFSSPSDGNLLKSHTSSCDTSFTVRFADFGTDKTDVDVGYGGNICSLLSISLTNNTRRRCFKNATSIRYCNSGYTDAPLAKVFLVLPPFVSMIKADHAFTAVSSLFPELMLGIEEKAFVFDVGTVKAGTCSTIHVTDSVICGREEIRGATVCTQAFIRSAESCSRNKNVSNVVVHSACKDGVLTHVARNVGEADMADSAAYQILLNSEVVKTGKYKLAAHDSLLISYRGSKQYTYSLNLNPNATPLFYSTEGNMCSSQFWTKGDYDSTKGYIRQLPIFLPASGYAKTCLDIRDSYDPNDKQVFPAGIESGVIKGGILPSQTLQYLLRFENTGTDTAFTVVLKDPLDPNLDLTTLQMGASSHPYKFQVGGENNALLEITFNDILLTPKKLDSTKSGGYVQFTINPKKNLTEGSEIENWAGIYFDFNKAVYTNRVLNTTWTKRFPDNSLLANIVTVQSSDAILGSEEAEIENVSLIYPNPTKGRLYLETKSETSVSLYNNHGIRCFSENILSSGYIDISSLPAGIYFMELISGSNRRMHKVSKSN